jgi:hypothetical protein
MFLPVLLVRDFGLAGFVAFALPNVIGAAALAWMISSPASARRILTEHRAMVRLFGTVTIAYQAFFACWLGLCITQSLPAPPSLPITHFAWFVPLLAMLALTVLPGTLHRRKRAWLAISVLVTLTSLAVITWAAIAHGIGLTSPSGAASSGPLALGSGLARSAGAFDPSVWPLAAACLLGFALCPYLDATFLRARVEADPDAKLAFGLGFGWLFAGMIVGTLVLAPVLAPLATGLPPSISGWLAGVGHSGGSSGGPTWALVLGVHVCVQLLFTARVHAMELAQDAASEPARSSTRRWLALLAVIVGAGLALLAWHAGPTIQTYAGGPARAGEIVYRLILGAYAVFFPAYVLICMWPIRLPTGERVTGPTGVRVAWWIAACALATPALWAGAIRMQSWWLLAGVAIVVAARFGAVAGVRRAKGL